MSIHHLFIQQLGVVFTEVVKPHIIVAVDVPNDVCYANPTCQKQSNITCIEFLGLREDETRKTNIPSETALTKIVKAKMKMINDALPSRLTIFLTTCCPTNAANVATTTKYKAARENDDFSRNNS